MIPDCDLLRQFVEEGKEAAFAEVVRRHADLVYSAALRLTNCNTALAPDVAQQVFIDLANKAGGLTGHPTLVGWLHRAVRYHAYNVIRTEQRRRVREHEATLMHENISVPETDWSVLSPLLDEAVGQLNAVDGEAVLLRFFQGKSHREVGEVLGLGEDSARKRIDRALDKLRTYFARKGVKISSALLAAEMVSHSAQAAPAGLAPMWSQKALAAKLTLIPTLGRRFSDAIFMSSTKSKTLLVATAFIIVAVGMFSYHSVAKPEPAQVIQARLVAKPLVESPVLAPVSVSNNQKSSAQNSSPGQDNQSAAVIETRHFTLSAREETLLSIIRPGSEGSEAIIKSTLIASGVAFPAGAKMVYSPGELYLTNTPANLDRAEAVIAELERDSQIVGTMETRDFALSPATESRILNYPEQGPPGLEGRIKSMLMAGGVNFPAGARIAYAAGKVYLTNTRVNLEQAAVVFAGNN